MVLGSTYSHDRAALEEAAVASLRSRLRKRGVAVCLSGVDGSGKSTLARRLVRIFEASGLPVRGVHPYQWYVNILVVPVLLLYNRWLGHKVLLLDRSIYDNIAALVARCNGPRWLTRVTLGVVVGCYPRFEYRLQLVVAFPEAAVRRPDTEEGHFVVLSRIYLEMAGRAKFTRLDSDENLYKAVLDVFRTRSPSTDGQQ